MIIFRSVICAPKSHSKHCYTQCTSTVHWSLSKKARSDVTQWGDIFSEGALSFCTLSFILSQFDEEILQIFQPFKVETVWFSSTNDVVILAKSFLYWDKNSACLLMTITFYVFLSYYFAKMQARCTILLHLVLITLLVKWGQIYSKLVSAQ